MRSSLFNHPNVLGMIIELSTSDSFHDHCTQGNDGDVNVTDHVLRLVTIGGLAVTWSVVRHRGEPQENGDCLLPGATDSFIDLMTNCPGFGGAMCRVGWAKETKDGLVFPDFFNDFNEVPKQPAKEGKERTAAWRDRQKTKSEGGVTKCDEVRRSVTTEKEKEKEIKKELPTVVPKKKVAERQRPPTVAEVHAYCAERGNTVDPEAFVDYYTARGWVLTNKQTMKDWKAAVRTWEKNRGNGSGQQATAGRGTGKTSAREHNQQISDYLNAELDKELGRP